MKKLLFALTFLFATNTFAAPVNINTADAAVIANALSGFGPKKAQAIVDYRIKNGEFKTLDDLNKVPGIGDKTIEKVKADILFSDSTSVPPEETHTSTKTTTKSGK
ncbi:MAG: ComEA family DNA-binding protein [Methylococcaceae bacterium]